MFDPAKFAMQMIQNNPQVMNNPMAKQYLEIIQNGDSAKGQEVANTLESIRTIWSSSDPELKKRMKADLTALVGELTV